MRKNYQLSLDHIQLPQAETEFYFSDEEDQEHQQTHTKARGVIKQEVKQEYSYADDIKERKVETKHQIKSKKQPRSRRQNSRYMLYDQVQKKEQYSAQQHTIIDTPKEHPQQIELKQQFCEPTLNCIDTTNRAQPPKQSQSLLHHTANNDQQALSYQEALRRTEQLLDQQLHQYKMRHLQEPASSLKSVSETRTSRVKLEPKLQVKLQLRQRSVTNRKKRTFIDSKVLLSAAAEFEKRKYNPLINLENIAEKINVGYTTICKLYKEWNQDSTLFRRKVRAERSKVRRMELDEVRMKVLEQVLYLNPYLQQNEMVDEMNKYAEIKQSKATITRFVIYDLLKNGGYVKKRGKKLAQDRNRADIKQERKKYCKVYRQLMRRPQCQVFFVGELVLNIYDARYEGWCKKEQDLVIRCPLAKSKNVSAVFVVHKNGSFISQVQLGSLTLHNFYMVVKTLMAQLEQNTEAERSYLIVDTSNLQSGISLGELGRTTNCEIVSVPPSSPQLSIIEYLLHQLRSKLKSKKLDSQQQLKEELQKLIREDQSKRVANYFERTELHVEQAMKQSDF